MRVKIRGLVFVGFAAAVFAQSAMADTTTDAKTVTSKLYVDSKVDKVTGDGTQASPYGDTTITANSPNDKAPSSQNVYKFVTSQVEGSAITPAVGSNAANYVDFTKSGNTLTVNFDQGVATGNGDITGTLTQTSTSGGTTTLGTADKLVTAGAVKSLIDTGISGTETDNTVPTSLAVQTYAEAAENKLAYSGGETITANKTSDIKFPTAKNVYEFVTTQGGNFQPKVDEAAATTMYVGKYVPDNPDTTNVDETSATWDKLTTGTYVSNTSTTAGTYTLDVPAAKITSATSDFAASGDTRAKLATAGTVYDFVNGNYQAKAAANTNTVQVGYNGGWGTLGGSTYVTVDPNSGSGTVSLTNLTSGTSEFVASNGSNDATRGKLAKSGDVYDFVATYGENTYQPKVATAGSVQVGYLGTGEGATAGWKTVQNSYYVRLIDTETSGVMSLELDPSKTASAGSTIADSTGATTGGGDYLTTAWAVKQYVNGQVGDIVGANMPAECRTSGNSGVYCALVASYDATLNNNAGGVKYEWTIMAPVPDSSSNP